jgi:hypothetical protein
MQPFQGLRKAGSVITAEPAFLLGPWEEPEAYRMTSHERLMRVVERWFLEGDPIDGPIEGILGGRDPEKGPSRGRRIVPPGIYDLDEMSLAEIEVLLDRLWRC